MILLDVNILLYAYDLDSPHQKAALRWLEETVQGPELIGLPWATIWAFVRVRTNPRLGAHPRTVEESFRVLREWLALPRVIVVEPGPRHLELLEELAAGCGAVGPLLSDAVLAALALEQGAALASTDRDFSRFTGLQWVNPLN